ncbi:MAG: restriction endonuclease subunit S [Syntrophomonadaceae bacterium]
MYDNKFLYYNLSFDGFFDYSMSTSKGTKMPRGDKSALMNYIVPLIPLSEQKSIAATLSCLDDMIELNNRTNQILEEIAQAIFKSWFIDFEFPNEDGEPYKSSGGEMVESELGEIPKGWRVASFTEEMKFAEAGLQTQAILHIGMVKYHSLLQKTV